MKRLLIIFAMLLFAAQAQAAIFYVEKGHGSASDANACTAEALPCLTIQGAFNKAGTSAGAGAGDIVEVNGTVGNPYDEYFADFIGGKEFPSGLVGNYFTFRAKVGSTVVIRQQSGQNIIGCSPASSRDLYLIVDGFKFDGSLIPLSGRQDPMFAWGGSGGGCNQIIFQNNEVYDTTGAQPAIHSINHNSTNVSILNNIFRNIRHGTSGELCSVGATNSDACGYVVYWKGSSSTFEGNTVDGIPSYAFQIYDFDAVLRRRTIVVD